MRIEHLASAAGLTVAWRPFDRSAMDRPPGTSRLANSPGPFSNPVKLGYMWRDLERRAIRHGLPYRQPAIYPVQWRQTAWVGLVGNKEGWGAAFTRRVFTMNFAEGRPIGIDDNLAEAVRDIGQDPVAVLAKAHQPQVESELLAATEEARARKMFGSPHFWVGGELFWGDDRLEEAIQWARR